MFTTFKRESGLVNYFQEGKWAFLLLSRGKVGLFTTFKRESGLFYYFKRNSGFFYNFQEVKISFSALKTERLLVYCLGDKK